MKNYIIFLLTLIILPAAAIAQKFSFTVSGKVGTFSAPYKAYLYYTHRDGFMADSVAMINGSFRFQGLTDKLRVAYFMIGTDEKSARRQQAVLYLEHDPVKISSPDSVKNAIVTGGPLNVEFNVLQKSLEETEKKSIELSKEYQSLSAENRKSPEIIAALQKKENAIEQDQRKIKANFIRNHPNSLVSFDILNQLGGAIPDVNEIGPLFNTLSEQIRTSPAGKEYGNLIEKLKKTTVGVIAPDFSEKDTAQRTVSLHDFRGKYVLVDFWASWCGPCRAENPNVVKAYQKYKDMGLEILGVSLDNTATTAAWIKAIHDDGVTWTQVSDLKGWENSAAVLYSVRAIPQNFLIDPDGKIVAKDLRGDGLNTKLMELFHTTN